MYFGKLSSKIKLKFKCFLESLVPTRAPVENCKSSVIIKEIRTYSIYTAKLAKTRNLVSQIFVVNLKFDSFFI